MFFTQITRYLVLAANNLLTGVRLFLLFVFWGCRASGVVGEVTDGDGTTSLLIIVSIDKALSRSL